MYPIMNSDIEKMLKHFYNISGLCIGLHDEHMLLLTKDAVISETYDKQLFCDRLRIQSPTFKRQCRECDVQAYRHVSETKQTYIYTCHCGFYEALVPVIADGTLLCCLTIGHVRPQEGYRSVEQILNDVGNEVTLTSELMDIHQHMPCMTLEKFTSYVYFLELCARELYEKRFIRLRGQDLSVRFERYVKEHYREPLHITGVADALQVSVPHLSKIISTELSSTFTDYLIGIRIEAAKNMLVFQDMSVTEIASALSYQDASYFMRIFKRYTGMTCMEYKKQRTIGLSMN